MLSVSKKFQVLKSDRLLFAIFLIHLLLAFFHLAYSFYTENNPLQCYIRAGFCAGIALATYLFLRGGFSITILAYACVLLYFNNFFNYTSFLFVLFAIYATPKLQPYAIVIYAIAVFIVFALKGYAILTLGIHGLNCVLFYACARYLFAANPQTTLLLTDDERLVLRELADGKMQKQIEAFSPNKVTKVIKNAMERNSCKTKTELLHRFIKENPPAAKPEQ
jgi:DNA-binding CsgD family transcriptional regulator